MKIIAIIPARKNSKRIKNKNKIILNKKKLIEHTFLVAKKSKQFNKILLTSDDKDIIKLSKKYKIIAPWIRPRYLSGDLVPSYKVIIHAYEWYNKKFGQIDGIFVLQPTSPFRKIKTITKMIKIYKKNKKKSVVCLSQCNEHPEWMLKIKKNKPVPYISKKYFTKRSQSLEKLYKVNGLGFLLSPNILKKEKTLVPKNFIPYVINSKIENLDIDDKEDYTLAKNISKFN